jgi:cytochrome P450
MRAVMHDAPTYFTQMRAIYGDIVRVPLVFYTLHLVVHPDAVRHVLQDNNANYVRGKGYDRFKLFMGQGLLTTDGDEWRERRRMVNPLFHHAMINNMFGAMAASSLRVAQDWERRARPGAPVELDVIPEMMELTLGAIGDIFFSTDLTGQRAAVGPAMATAIDAMVFRGTANHLTPQQVPIPYNREIARARATLYEIVERIVIAHRDGEGAHGAAARGDLVSLLLSATDAETGQPLPYEQIRDEIMTVFMAGHETSGTGLAWALYEIARNRDVQERLQEEVDRVLGDREPTLADLARLPVTSMVTDETLRLHPPIWVFPRDAVGDDELLGWRLPAGGTVFLAPYLTHRHPDYWPDPERFVPDRFTDEAVAARPRYAYYPFGGGQRKCLGNQMALMQTKIALAMLMQRFDLAVSPGHRNDLGTQVSLRPVHGIRLSISARRR